MKPTQLVKNFSVTSIEAGADEDAEIPVYRARLASAETDTGAYVQFERQMSPDEQGTRLGFHRPHIEIHEQAFSGYGLVELVTLLDNTLNIHFNAKGRRVFEMENPYQLTIDPDLDVADFVTLMKHIFGDSFQRLS